MTKHPDDDIVQRLEASLAPGHEWPQWKAIEPGAGNFFDGLMSLDGFYDPMADLDHELSDYLEAAAAVANDPNDPGISPEWTNNLVERIEAAISNENRAVRSIASRLGRGSAPGMLNALEYKQARLRSLRPKINELIKGCADA